MSQRFPAVSSGAVPRRIRAHADDRCVRNDHFQNFTSLHPDDTAAAHRDGRMFARCRAAVGAFHGKTSVGGAM
ncbi:hypothetical protein [Burkholderia pseudomultivorans]|uniref:hypothetical protein n=1 Tax=Burkholderia pseudomultivorans TaxID=1207504 RepID=UPI0012D9E8BE|nr:hypothetical protein [Burkholderia pseudomultivorans]